LIERIEAFHKRVEAERADRMKPVHVELARRQCQLQIDSTAARQILDLLPVESNPYDSQGILVENIARREFCFNVGRCGRVANCITSLKRELRATLNVRNEPLTSVDLSCAQPAFVAKLFLCSRGKHAGTQARGTEEHSQQQTKSIYDAPLQPPGLADSELFRQLGQSGKLYEYLAADLLKHGVDLPRETLKRRFLCDVFAKRKANQRGTIAQRTRDKLADIGLIDTRSMAAGKPMGEHVTDFAAALRSKGGCVKHSDSVVMKVEKIVAGCAFRFWHELSADAVNGWLDKQRADKETKMSLQTSNHYLQAVKQFAQWMVESRRASSSPVAHLKRQNVEADRRHSRRALSADELKKLISTTADNVERYGMTGVERALVYRLAVETGLRASELASLMRASFHFGDDVPTVHVAAGYSKRRRNDVLPLRVDTAAELAKYLSAKLPAATAFNLPKSDKTAKMFRSDLADARKEWIKEAKEALLRAEREQSDFLAYKSHAGLVADFHSLRGAFVTGLARGGAHLALTQSMARHCDPSLTANVYTHITLAEQSKALVSLPDLSSPMREAMRATGTDGRATPVVVTPVVEERPGCVAFCVALNDAEQVISMHPVAPEGAAGEAAEIAALPAETTVFQADGEGFEPPVPLRVRQFSRLLP
jgi:integrase